jgi:PAS domain S-box-containing protein
MARKKKISDINPALRSRAEKMLTQRGEPDKIPPADMRRMFHELEVHQIELELQNNELRRAQEELEASRQKYFDLYDLAPQGYVTLNEKGIILENNLTAAALFGKERSDLVEQPLTSFILEEDQDIYYFHNKRLFETRAPQECEVRMSKGDGLVFWAGLETVVVSGNDGELTLRTMISDITERKQADEERRRSQQTLSELVERSPFGTYIVDAQFRIAQMNASSQEGAFRNVRPVIGRPFDEAMRILWPEDVAVEIIGHFRHTLNTGKPYFSRDFIRPRHDAEIVEAYEWELHRMTLPDGQYGVICYYYDSTKLRDAEAALRESEDRLRFALETIQTGAWDLDLVDHTSFRSVEHDRVFGYASLLPQWTYEMFLEHVLPEDRAAVDGKFRRAIEHRGDWNFECRIRRVDGEVRWIWAAGRHRADVTGAPRRMAGIVQDITARKQAEAELRTSEERFRLLVANVKDYAIFMLDPEGRVVTWNAGAEHLKGYKAEAIIGENFSRFYTAEDVARNKPEKELKTALELGQAEEEGWRVRKDGSIFWASVLITALRDDNGILHGFAKITRDITERKQAEEAARESERTQRLLAQVGEVATRLLQSEEMIEAIGEFVAKELGVSRCGFSRVDMGAGQVTVLKDYHSHLSALAGVYPMSGYADYLEEGLAGRAVAFEDTATDPRTTEVYATNFAPIRVRAHLTVPLLRGGEWVANFWVSHHEPRHWTAAEVKTMTLIADRVWLALERQRVDGDLRKSEERFRALTMASSDVVYRMSPDWSEMLQLHGRGFIADTEKPNRNWLQEYIHPDDQSHVMAVINEAIQTKGIFELEHRVLRVDGSLGWTFSRAIPLLDANGEIVEWFGAASDVSDRRQAEWEQETVVEFLRLVNESRNTLELVKTATAFFQERTGCEGVGIRLREEHDYPYFETRGFPAEFVRAESRLCVCDKDGRPILDSAGNPALECMCGNVICGRFDPSKPFFTKRGNFWSNSTTGLLATTSDKDRQAKTRNRCNGEGYESVALIGLSLGNERLGLLQLNDRRKDRFTPESLALWERLGDYLAIALAKFHTDEQLQRSEEHFRTLADSIPNLAWWANGDGYITWYNQRWYEYTGTTPEQMEGWGWQSVHDPNVLPKVIERWKTSIATGKPFDMEFPLRGTDGVFRPFLTRVMPVKDSAGLVLRWFGTNTDISAQKQVEESLLHRTAELEIVNRELESFIYSVSHDLRAPLRHIAAFTDLLMRSVTGKFDEKEKRYFSNVLSGAEKMSRLIDDLLNLSRISRQDVRRTEFNMSTVATLVVTELRETNPGRTIEVDIKEDITVYADRGLIEVVLSNLLGNAWKFTRKTEHAHIEFGTLKQEGKVIYYVKDNGAGFDQQYAGKMFWPFHRLHSEQAFEGTGIGLAIADRIIRLHGGKIWAEGAEGTGATIYFSLH